MASSLEELLAEEGFRGRTSVTRSRSSVRLEASSKSDSPFSNRVKTERTRSNVSRLEGLERGGSSDRREGVFRGNEVVEIGFEETERANDAFAIVGRHSLGRRDKRNDNASTKYLLGRRSYSDKHRNNLNLQDAAYDNANKGSWNRKSFKDGHREKHDDPVPTVPQPALDEVAVQAITTMTLKTVIVNLEQAIETVEKAVTESISAKELKKASLKLSVITGLNSNDLKDSLTSGFPNAVLSSCAHFYLSVIYKLQKEDRVSARHLLQVFRDSPSQERTNPLPKLCDDLFHPHLSHLEAWYYQEASFLSDAPSRKTKLKLLEKVYNETVDSSTYQLASYYKDWLTEGTEALSFPSIDVPSVSVGNIQQEVSLAHSPDLGSPTSPFSPQSMEDGISSTAKEAWRLPGLSMLQQKEAYNMWKTTAHDYDELHAPAPLTANELMLKRLAEPAFQLRQTKITDDLTLSGLPNFSGDSVCRYQIARDINKQCLFELVCSEQVSSRTNAVMLLTELICLSRRKDVPLLVSDLQDEEITNIMYSIHDYLQNSPLVRRPLVATLLLNIDLLVDPKKYGLYRNQAVDAITEALDSSLIDEEVREKCCRALLILGGRFSLSGKLLTEDCILKVAGFKDDHEANSIKKEADLYFDDSTLSLKQNLESGAQVQHKFIASMSLLNLKPRIQGPANDDCRRYGESSKKPY
ncbi:Detected protein of unknown function [Hibiscus syriacus]|uniref:Uncharacterized protein n=1 Tax=Hibiscus syriacus TaxID=106335 RepID=A0A6A3AS17_HIBSY|nr:Detected protein of unknown function [Hibiscus syriacus]